MELDLPGDLLKGVVGWEEPVPGPDPVGIVSALIVELDYPIRWVHPAIA